MSASTTIIHNCPKCGGLMHIIGTTSLVKDPRSVHEILAEEPIFGCNNCGKILSGIIKLTAAGDAKYGLRNTYFKEAL